MKNILKFGVIACAITVPVLANSATTAELKLIGTIIPASCVPNFTGGSTIDYGTIPASTLNATEPTSLPNKTTSFTITCDAPVKFGFSVTDERNGTAVVLEGATAAIPMFGLGAAENGAPIGGYHLSVDDVTSDSGDVVKLLSRDGGVTWGGNSGNIYADGAIVGFTDSFSSFTPKPYKFVSFDVDVFAYIDKAANLPIANEIKIDGLATIEVKYL